MTMTTIRMMYWLGLLTQECLRVHRCLSHMQILDALVERADQARKAFAAEVSAEGDITPT